MNTSLYHTSTPAATPANGAEKTGSSSSGAIGQVPRGLAPALLAFFTTVFTSMAAAAAVVNNDIALMVVGL